MDNEASITVMRWLERKKVDAQKVSPHNHRANTAEIMIETVKHHFIAGMVGTEENYPIREWDRGVAQSQRTLNMLLPCITRPVYAKKERNNIHRLNWSIRSELSKGKQTNIHSLQL